MNLKIILTFAISIAIILIGSTIVHILTQKPNEEINAPLNTEITLKISDSVIITDQGIKVTLTDVTNDSRCPSDVDCIWEGSVSVEINIVFNGQNLGKHVMDHSNLYKVSFMGYYVKLTLLEPYPVSTETIQPDEYTATLKVSAYGPD